MEQIKSNLGQRGIVLAAIGIISTVTSIFNYNIRLLTWLDIQENTMRHLILILLFVVGGALLFLFRNSDSQ